MILNDSSSIEDVAGLGSLRSIVSDSVELARLRGHLQVDGQIIIWAHFWVGISKLLSTGISLDDLITAADSALIASLSVEDTNNSNNNSMIMQSPFRDSESTLPAGESVSRKRHPSPSPVHRSHGQGDSSPALKAGDYRDDFQLSYGQNYSKLATDGQSSATSVRFRSDSDLARELHSQLNGEPSSSSSSSSSSAVNLFPDFPTSSSWPSVQSYPTHGPRQQQQQQQPAGTPFSSIGEGRFRSDSDLARELQAQLDSEFDIFDDDHGSASSMDVTAGQGQGKGPGPGQGGAVYYGPGQQPAPSTPQEQKMPASSYDSPAPSSVTTAVTDRRPFLHRSDR